MNVDWSYVWRKASVGLILNVFCLSVTHRYIDSEGTEQEYVLESNSLLYALPIPYDAMERNYKLKQKSQIKYEMELFFYIELLFLSIFGIDSFMLR